MKFSKNYEDLTREEQIQFDAILEEHFARERTPIVTYLPSASMNLEDTLAPSDDVNHPNYKGIK